jgi:hypothetical protein
MVWIAVAVSGVSALAITLLPGVNATLEVWLGLAGPATITIFEWTATEQVHRLQPERLTGLMVWLFFGKMVFFAVYVAAILGTGLAEPVGFVVAFTGYFLVLLVAEAVALKRLLTPQADTDSRQPRAFEPAESESDRS